MNDQIWRAAAPKRPATPNPCGQCRFFEPRFGGDEKPYATGKVGECRHDSPTPDTVSHTPDVLVEIDAIWPIVYADEWCGEYEGAGRAEVEWRRAMAAWADKENAP